MKTKLAGYLKETGTTQEQFADLLKVSVKTINHYCNGGTIPYNRAVEIVSWVNVIKHKKSKEISKKATVEDIFFNNLIKDE